MNLVHYNHHPLPSGAKPPLEALALKAIADQVGWTLMWLGHEHPHTEPL
jgi:hypothetical protein